MQLHRLAVRGTVDAAFTDRRLVMKTLLASIITCALAAPAAAGPDFTTRTPRPDALAASPASSEIGPLDDVVFAHDSTALSEAALAQVTTAAHWLRKHPDQRIVLEGYTDSTGAAYYNEDLATRRAYMVRQHLIRLGVPADRVVVVIYGEAASLGG